MRAADVTKVTNRMITMSLQRHQPSRRFSDEPAHHAAEPGSGLIGMTVAHRRVDTMGGAIGPPRSRIGGMTRLADPRIAACSTVWKGGTTPLPHRGFEPDDVAGGGKVGRKGG